MNIVIILLIGMIVYFSCSNIIKSRKGYIQKCLSCKCCKYCNK